MLPTMKPNDEEESESGHEMGNGKHGRHSWVKSQARPLDLQQDL